MMAQRAPTEATGVSMAQRAPALWLDDVTIMIWLDASK